MRSLLITIDFPGFGTNRSGGGLVALRYARALHAAGVTCGIFNGETAATADQVLRSFAWKDLAAWSLPLVSMQADKPLAFKHLARALESVCREFVPDIIHILQYECWNGCLAPVLKRLGIPVVFTALDYGPFCARSTLVQGSGRLCDGHPSVAKCSPCLSSGRTPLAHWARKVGRYLPAAAHRLPGMGSLVRDATRNRSRLGETLDSWPEYVSLVREWIAPSRAMMENLKVHGVAPSRLNHVPYGLDSPAVRPEKPAEGTVVFGYAGRPIFEKGFHLLTQAFAQVASLHPGARLKLFVPRGQMSNPYAAKAFQPLREIEHRIEWGSFDGADEASISQAHSQIHAMVVPSIWQDNLPLTVVESLANGTPVIASRHSSAAEPIVEGENGLLFDYGKPGSLEKIMGEFVSDHPKQATLLSRTMYPRDARHEALELLGVYQKTCG